MDEEMAAEVRKLRTELFVANEKVREAEKARARAEDSVEPLRQRLSERYDARSQERAQERRMSRVERRRMELKEELARLDGQA